MVVEVKKRAAVLGLAVALGSPGISSAAVLESQFPPRTVQDLIAICSPAKDDPMMTAAINYCHGYAEGAVVVEMAHESQRGGRKLFCLPNPPPPSGSELGSFIVWANQDPSRLMQPAIYGMFLYLAQKYPCANQSAGTGRR